MAKFSKHSARKVTAYIDLPGSPLHGEIGTLGRRDGKLRDLHVAGGKVVTAVDTAVRPVTPPTAQDAWKDTQGQFRTGDVVQGRLGPGTVVNGPVPTPLGVVYRIEDASSGHEYDDWEHNLTASPQGVTASLDPDDTTTFIAATDFIPELGAELRAEVEMGHWTPARLREIAARHGEAFYDVTPEMIDWDNVGMFFEEQIELEDDQPVSMPNAVPTDWTSQSDNPSQMEEMVRNAGWKQAGMSRIAKLVRDNSDVLKSHMIRLAWVIESGKIDKLADKARINLYKRPDVTQWMEADARNNNGELSRQLASFFDDAPAEAFKLFPWMWTQIKSDPAALTSGRDAMFDIGKTFQLLNRNNKPTPDIHKLDLDAAKDWLSSPATQELVDDLTPTEWEDPDHHFTASDGKHVVHKLKTRGDCSQEGKLMGHCVGQYGDRAESGQTHLFSLRDAKHRPHVTVEMLPGERQAPPALEVGDRVYSDNPNLRFSGEVAASGQGQVKVRPDEPWMLDSIRQGSANEDGTIWIPQSVVKREPASRYNVGDMVLMSDHVLEAQTGGDPGPYPVVSVRQGNDGGAVCLVDMSGAGGSDKYYTAENSGDITSLADGTVPEIPKRDIPEIELPNSLRVTQVFGKGDQAPIEKYRKMTREFFDHLREKGHDLKWAGNEFLPEHVSDLEELEEFSELMEQIEDNIGEDADHTDTLGIARSIMESGSMAHQYGFEDRDEGPPMTIDWSALFEDFVEKVIEGSDRYGGSIDADELVASILELADVAQIPTKDIQAAVRNAYDMAESARDEKRSEIENKAEQNDGHEIAEDAREIRQQMIDEDQRAEHVDHNMEEAYSSDMLDEDGDPLQDTQDQASNLYEELEDNHLDESEQRARDNWRENFDPYDYDSSLGDPVDAIDRIANELSEKVEPRVERLLEMANNPSTGAGALNQAWDDLVSSLSAAPSGYGFRTNALPNLIQQAHAYANKLVSNSSKISPPVGWQQQLPKGEVPVHGNERVEAVLKKLDELLTHTRDPENPIKDISAHNSQRRKQLLTEQLQQRNLHQVVPAAPSQNQWTPQAPAWRVQAPPQRDLITEQQREEPRAQAVFKDSTGMGILQGDVIRNPQYGDGTVQSVSDPDSMRGQYMTIHYPENGQYNYTMDNFDPAQMTRVGSMSGWRLAADEADPEWSFVYHEGRLKMVEWSHTNRHRKILKDLLAENGKELVDDIDDSEIVGGTVTDGKAEFEGFATPELQAEAEEAIRAELGGTAKPEDSDEGVTPENTPQITVNITIDGWTDKT